MEHEKTINISPVCRFGPGGDFYSNWPSKWPNPAQNPKNALNRLLNIIAGAIQAIRSDSAEYSISGPEELTHSQPSNTETLLFADDLCGNKPVEHKPAGRIRPYRPVIKKKPSLVHPAQPTLFDAEFKNAKTA